jgi:hypothetical protein
LAIMLLGVVVFEFGEKTLDVYLQGCMRTRVGSDIMSSGDNLAWGQSAMRIIFI